MSGEELIERHIGVDPWRGWAEARLIRTGVSVWALIGALPASNYDLNDLAADYDLSAEEIEAAMAYYRRHRPYIDAGLLLNEAAFT